ncbi:MAG: hypothetical protein KAQ98_14260 [Bacteriovoracaceae bacterium]|nr:hypothetical protein [Bacteriovoracaceae bacterium]
MSFEQWIEQKIPDQNAYDRLQNMAKNTPYSMPQIKSCAEEFVNDDLYPNNNLMDKIEAHINYSVISKLETKITN